MHLIKSYLLIGSRYIYGKLHKFNFFENSKIYFLFHLLWIFLIGSSHGKRYRLFLNDYKNSEFKSINWKIKKRDVKNVFFIIGDSNSEHLGRNYLAAVTKNVFYTIWTGPTLLVSFCKSKVIMEKIIFLTKFFINYHGSNSKFHFIFSFGQIDIRTIFYNFLVVEKYYKNSKYLIKDYIDSINEALKILKNKIKKNKKSLKFIFYIKEINPSSSKKGTLPKKNLINSINKKRIEPIFGSLEQRKKWRKELNLKILNNKKKKYRFLFNVKEICDHKNDIFNKKYGDGNHLTNMKLIIKFQKRLILNENSI